MDALQMLQRCPSAVLLGVAMLESHQLGFAGWSASWGGGVATVLPSRGHAVPGVLWAVTRQDLERLDRFEGVAGESGAYVRRELWVSGCGGKRWKAQVYIKKGEEPARPSRAYLEVIRRAYQAYGFDEAELIWAAEVADE